jgi:hypothetical protein
MRQLKTHLLQKLPLVETSRVFFKNAYFGYAYLLQKLPLVETSRVLTKVHAFWPRGGSVALKNLSLEPIKRMAYSI